MRYTVNKTNYRDFDVYELNKRPARAYFIPYGSKAALEKTSFADERFHSDMVEVLSGQWDFKYYPTESEMPDLFDTEKEPFDKINVPSTWQRTGYESPVYLNCPYEFETLPPKLPKEMSVGVYRKIFHADANGGSVILAFLGVIPCVDVYINGEFVGYSEGAHNTAEFDITKYLKDEENELLAVLRKWSTGTFLECQDMFRENGIFRDVLLYRMPGAYINDYYLKTECSDGKWLIGAEIAVCGDFGGCSVELELKDGEQTVASANVEAAEKALLTLENLPVQEWNAEIPKVYQAYITLKKEGREIEAIRQIVGFKRVKIEGQVFKFNGANIKMKGVNHHDTHHKTGYVMTYEDLEKDVKLMKSLNVNAVRTSHYPPDANLLTLCDLYGLYVVDEADIETHGCGGYPIFRINYISNSAKWIPRYLDRVSRMYYRDRNHACVTMWSLGNEAGGHKCQDACYAFLHEVCPEIPVHYEGVIRTPRHSYDVVSEMYTHPDDLKKVRDGKRGPKYKNKPFYLCEYCHAMGVGPGALEDYWDIFYSSDIFMGGCIWEWADHAVYHVDGKLTYTYGGDHGERKHDGNFCVDGLMYPDRTPHTGAFEMKAVYRPVRARLSENGNFVFTNTNRFRDASYLTVRWKLLKNGIKIQNGEIPLSIQPQAEQEIPLDLDLPAGCDLHINFRYIDDNGHEVALEQLALREEYSLPALKNGRKLDYAKSGDLLTVSFDRGHAVFNKKTGAFEQYTVDGKDLFHTAPVEAKGFVPNIFRALLDNDVRKRKSWLNSGYDKCSFKLKSFEFEDEDGKAEIETEYIIKHSRAHLFTVKLEYEIGANGCVFVNASLKPCKDKKLETDLPRFGLMLELPRDMENAEYYGLGELENLIDFRAQSTVGIYRAKVAELHEPYIKPQDNGNHGEVRWLKVTDNDGKGLMFGFADKPFSFSLHHYTQKLLQNAKHREDLKDENTTVLSIDGFMRGTGTSSCGPDTLPEYIFDAKDGLSFKFVMSPVE